MKRVSSIYTKWGFYVFLFTLGVFFLADTARAQLGTIHEDRRIDVGYKLKGYAYSYVPNQYFSGKRRLVRKGYVTGTYKSYLSEHVFWNADAGFLLHNHQTSFFGGPIDFNAVDIGASIGVRWGNVSLYTGLTGGLNWNYRIRFETADQSHEWFEAASPSHSINGGFRAGFKYHLLSFLTIKSEIRNTHYVNNEIKPVVGPDRTPSILEAEMSEFSASVGISIGIPWETRKAEPETPSYPSTPRPSPPAAETEETEAGETTEPAGPPEPPPITRPAESVPAPLAFSNPLSPDRIVTSPFGDNRGHEGWDLNLNIGDTVKAVMDGMVTRTTWVGAYGKMVELKHPAGYSSRYAHLNKVLVQDEQEVDRGEPIGLGGNTGRSTGPHLHFELLRHNYPVNPRQYLQLDWDIQQTSPLGY